MPATFIDKKDLLATPVQIPGLVPPSPGGMQPFGLGAPTIQQNPFDPAAIESILSHIERIMGTGLSALEKIEKIRATSASAFGQYQQVTPPAANQTPQPQNLGPFGPDGTRLPAQLVVPSQNPPPPAIQAPEPAPIPPKIGVKLKKGDIIVPPFAPSGPVLNEARAKELIDEMISEMGSHSMLKDRTCGTISYAYHSSADVKNQIDAVMVGKLRAWLPRLASP